MNGPTRLRELSENELESALLGVGTDYRSSPRMRAKTLAALGFAGSAALGGTALATEVARSAIVGSVKVAKLTGKVTWLKTLISVPLLTAAVAIPTMYAVRSARGPDGARTVAPISSRAPAEGGAPSPPLAIVPTPAAEIAESASAAPALEQAGWQTGDRRRAARRAAARTVLTRELAMLDAARASVASGSPASALSLLDTYDAAFAGGVLRLEAEVLRVEALAKSGQTDKARAHAQRFLRRHPTSPLARRVRVYATASRQSGS